MKRGTQRRRAHGERAPNGKQDGNLRLFAQLGVRLSADVALRLREYCRASEQSINATVEAALTEYLDRKKG